MEDTKYRILYTNERVVNVLEDIGTTFIGDGTGIMCMVDTKENAKLMLEAIGINTTRLFNESASPITESPLVGLDYINHLESIIDPLSVYNV